MLHFSLISISCKLRFDFLVEDLEIFFFFFYKVEREFEANIKIEMFSLLSNICILDFEEKRGIRMN